MKKLFLAISALAALFCASCVKEDGGIKSITITSGEHYNIYAGHTISLDVALTPAKADPSAIKWSSSDDNVAVVTNGFVTGVSEGNATITASAGKASASVTVTVSNVNVTGFSLVKPGSIGPGETAEVLVQNIQPDYANACNINWSLVDSGNMEYFRITGVQPDKVMVKAAEDAKDGYWSELYGRNNDNTYHNSVKVTVIYNPLQSMSLDNIAIPAESTKSITCKLTPQAPTTPYEILWSSSNSSVATVEGNGTSATVTAIQVGTADIVAKDKFTGISAKCTVTVLQKRDFTNTTVGFYQNCTEVTKNYLWSVSRRVGSATMTILPCRGTENFYVGLDDGYALSTRDGITPTLTTGGSIQDYASEFVMTTPYCVFARIAERDATGSITVRIPNGSSATLNFKTQVKTFSMEKEGSNGWTAFASGTTTVPVGGTFTITRPSKNENSNRYQFCVNCGDYPVRHDGDTVIMISNCESMNCYVTGWECPALKNNGALDNNQILKVSYNTPTGTYVFTNSDSAFRCYNGLEFTVVIK